MNDSLEWGLPPVPPIPFLRNIIVYISGKYSGDISNNIAIARKAAIEVWQAGFTALTPHLNTIHFERDCDCNWNDFLDGDLELVKRCNCLLMLEDWQESKGANLEHQKAKDLHIPIFYSLNELINFYDSRTTA